MSGSDLKRSILIKAVFLNMRDISRVCCSRFFLFPCANFFANVLVLQYSTTKQRTQHRLNFFCIQALYCAPKHTLIRSAYEIKNKKIKSFKMNI